MNTRSTRVTNARQTPPTGREQNPDDGLKIRHMKKKTSGGLVHELPADLCMALTRTAKVTGLWENLTPIGRNEFICWVENAKQEKTRERRITRTIEELLEGKKRPCCWAGCIHRTDKKPGRWQQDVLIDKKSRK